MFPHLFPNPFISRSFLKIPSQKGRNPDRGYVVFLIEIWSVGRSSSETLDSEFAGGTAELIGTAFTAPELYKKDYQARFLRQWPGVHFPEPHWHRYPISSLQSVNTFLKIERHNGRSCF